MRTIFLFESDGEKPLAFWRLYDGYNHYGVPVESRNQLEKPGQTKTVSGTPPGKDGLIDIQITVIEII